jgi:hypothetical protein
MKRKARVYKASRKKPREIEGLDKELDSILDDEPGGLL